MVKLNVNKCHVSNIKYKYLEKTSESLIAFVKTSEYYRKKFSEQLREAQ